MIAAALLATRTLLLVHVMPWFMAPPMAPEYGWHWTMGKTDAAKGELASWYRPLGGAYDSSDPAIVERQALQMKIAGFDGMLVDWYGDRNYVDYGPLDRATGRLFDAARRARISFALVYEDQTVPKLIAAGAFRKDKAEAEGRALFARTSRRWFGSPTYQKIGGKPLLLVFGPQYYPDAAWPRILPSTAFYTLHSRRAGAAGAYDWPLPGPPGEPSNWEARRREMASSVAIPVAFPRFRDYYAAAGAGPGYAEIPDDEGRTFERTLREATASGAPLAQVATWNDWGEGTQIEPSEEFGYRDLEAVQRRRRELDPAFPYASDDLRLPMRLFRLRREKRDRRRLDRAAAALAARRPAEARAILSALERAN